MKALIGGGRVTGPEGALVRDPSAKAVPGGAYALSVPEPTPAHNEAQDIAVEIVFQDDQVIGQPGSGRVLRAGPRYNALP